MIPTFPAFRLITLLRLVGCGSIIQLFSQAVYAQAPLNYTVANNVAINLRGEEINYFYNADRLEGRYNNRLRRFEFLLPLQEVQPADGKSDLDVFLALFQSESAMSDNFQLVVYLPSEMRNFTSLRNGKTMQLTGECTIGGKLYKMPVTMELLYNNNLLRYGFDLEIASTFQPIVVPAALASLNLRLIQLSMQQGSMDIAMIE